MSQLTVSTSLLALTLLCAGAGGFWLSEEAPAISVNAEAKPAAISNTAKLPVAEMRTPDRVIRLLPGETLTEALSRTGVAGLDAALADRSVGQAQLVDGKPVKLWLGRSIGSSAKQLDRLEAQIGSQSDLVLIRKDDDFVSQIAPREIDDTPVRMHLEADDYLTDKLRSANVPGYVLDQVRSLAASATDAASFELLVEHEEIAGVRQYGQLLYFAVRTRSGQVRRWLRDESGSLKPLRGSTDVGPPQRPVPGPISSSMGLRVHPVLRSLRWHKGTDFASSEGTSVRAALPGRVTDAGWRGGYGRTVRLSHAGGTSTLYAHLRTIDVMVGEQVAKGSVIGAVGSTGLTTGPHLHFELVRNGNSVAPQFAQPASLAGQGTGSDLALLRNLLSSRYREPPGSRS